jgi:hypothetical protein
MFSNLHWLHLIRYKPYEKFQRCQVQITCVENNYAKTHIKLSIKSYLNIFFIFDFEPKYWFTSMYTCKKSNIQIKILIWTIHFFSHSIYICPIQILVHNIYEKNHGVLLESDTLILNEPLYVIKNWNLSKKNFTTY